MTLNYTPSFWSEDRLKFDPIWYELTSRLIQAEQMEEVQQITEVFAAALGCEYYSFTVRAPISLTKPALVVVSNLPAEWIEHYIDQNYFTIDPLLHAGEKKLNAFTWNEAFISDLGVEVHEVLEEFDLHDGVSVAQHGANNALGIFSCVTSKSIGKDCHDKFAKRLLVKGYAGLLLDKLQVLMPDVFVGTEEQNPLSDREKDCLRWAAEGKTSWEIGQIMGIAESTVVHHLRNAGLKLGTTKRQGAVTNALANGYLEYTWQEAANKNLYLINTEINNSGGTARQHHQLT